MFFKLAFSVIGNTNTYVRHSSTSCFNVKFKPMYRGCGDAIWVQGGILETKACCGFGAS